MRHNQTGEPIPDELLDKLAAAERFDRNFSTSLEFLATAIIDLELHSATPVDGKIDVAGIEQSVLQRLNMPRSRDALMRSYHAYHTFTQVYAAGVYTYYWSDSLAADIEQSFLETPEGLRNAYLLKRYKTFILNAANTIPAGEAFRKFKGRDPEPDALFRRYGIEAPDTGRANP